MNPEIARRRRAKAAQQHQHPTNGRGSRIGQRPAINVGHMERQLSMLGGTVLAVYGLLNRSLTGLTLAALGGALIWRGSTGHCQLYAALGHNSAEEPAQKQIGPVNA
jgi:uncharacterized membrane protein